MTTFKKTHKRKVSNLVKRQLPDFVLEDHPKFAEFVKSYFLFLESAQLEISSFTAVDNILLEGEGTADNFVLLERTDSFGLDAGDKVVNEELSFSGTFRKKEVITGATSGATATILAEDFVNSKYTITANNGFITGETVTGATSGATGIVGKYRANPIENIQQLLNYSDPDHTIADFLNQMKEEFLNTIPTDTDASLDTRKLIKNIKSLYRAKGTDKAHKAFFRILFNENSEVYKPTEDMLRVSDGEFSTNTFIRCTQTTAQALNDPIFLVGQQITQTNNPADATINEATAIVENITKFREGTVEIIEVEINDETTTGTFVTGQTIEGASFDDPNTIVKLTVSQGVATTTITNAGATLTIGDEATVSGGAGSGARIQVGDITGAGVTEVIVNAVGTGFQEFDTLTFSSGTAQAKVAVVNGGFAPETGSVAIHVELESGTITGSGSGDLLLEDAIDSGAGGKLLDSASQEVENEIRFELENEVGHLLAEDDDNQVSDTFFILNQESQPNTNYNMEATDHIVLELETQDDGLYLGDKIVQENSTGVGDITDIRMIASGGGYTTLPTATISGDRFISLEDATSNVSAPFSRIELEQGGRLLSDIAFDGADATVIPYGDDIGKATSLSIIEHGIDFTSAPTLAFPKYAILKTVSGAITEDETFTSNVSGATGTVVSFVAPLLKYTATTSELEVGDTVTFSGGTTAIVVKSNNLTATTTVNTRIQTAGRYISQDGHLSEVTKKIQDSLYYQDYSYVIKVSESITKWRDALKKAVHPSGFYVTGEVNIASRLDVQVRQPVGASLSSGLFSGTSDSPIYMRLNTLFSTLFDRRTGVGLRSMSDGVQLDGKTKLSSAVARAGVAIEPQNDYRDPTTNTQKAVNLSPETTIETEKRSRNSFYSLNSYKVRSIDISNGFAYAGPRMANLRSPFTRYAHNNGILLEGHTETGNSNVKLENESGVLTSEFGISASTTIADWAQLRFGGTRSNARVSMLEDGTGAIINETAGTDTGDGVDEFRLEGSVDGSTMRFQDLEGTNSNFGHRNNFAFPTDVTSEPS